MYRAINGGAETNVAIIRVGIEVFIKPCGKRTRH
jgi:hypothetical protein